MTPRKKLAVGLGLALVILTAVGWVSYTGTAQLLRSSYRVRHAYRIREYLGILLPLIRDAEAGVDDYVMTGDEHHLELYDGATKAIDQNVQHLRILIAHDAAQQRRLEALQSLIAARVALLGDVVAVRREKGRAAAEEVIDKRLATKVIDHVRAVVHQMKAAETVTLKRRQEESRASSDKMQVALAIGALLALAILFSVFYFLDREIVERDRTEAKFRGLLESAPDAMVIVDKQGKIVLVNSQTQRLFGYGRRELVGQAVDLLIPQRLRNHHAEHRLRYFTDPQPRPMGAGLELRAVRKDGSEFPVEVSLSPLETTEGMLVTSVVRDITQRKQAEDALVESEVRQRMVSELASDYAYAFRVEPDGSPSVEWVTGAFERITGFTVEEAEARGGGITLVHPDDMRVVRRRLRTLLSGQPDTSEFRIVTKSGEIRWIRETGRPVWDEARGRLRVFGAAQDITDRKQAEAAVRQREAELAHVLRVATIGEMAVGLAHEINQPLGAIVSYAKGCVRRLSAVPGRSSELVTAIEAIATQAVRADQIVRRLANFVRKREPQRERVDVNALIREATRLVEGEAQERGIRIQLSLSPDLPSVEVDSIQVEQVILNLVRNGFEAMAGSGLDKRVLSIQTTMVGDDAVEVAICDSGRGFTATEVDKIFEAFFTTKLNGLGMGLVISRSIIEAYGGRLWGTPNRDRGATFRFTLPVFRGEHPDVA